METKELTKGDLVQIDDRDRAEHGKFGNITEVSRDGVFNVDVEGVEHEYNVKSLKKHQHTFEPDGPTPYNCIFCGEPIGGRPKKTAWTEPTAMKALGYSLMKDDGTYAEYINDAGTASLSYGIMPKGKRIIHFNRGYNVKQGVFVGISEDGGTRQVFYGVCDTEVLFRLILNAVR